MHRLSFFFFAVLGALYLVACGDDDSTDAGADATADSTVADTGADVGDPDAGSDTGADVEAIGCPATDPVVVQFTTDDDLMLEGDLYLSGRAGGAAAVLLHMIPPSNDRSNYPRAFIDQLVSRCITVLNVDRRGAGGSEGDPVDAYMGPNGVFDAKGAVEFLVAHESAPDATRVAVVGASNGTTTTLDFTVFAESSRVTELPGAIVLLSGGTYTENQNVITDTTLTIPTLFVYPVAEAEWNEPFAVDAPEAWQFNEYTPGAHGTGVFSANTESQADVANFLTAVLGL